MKRFFIINSIILCVLSYSFQLAAQENSKPITQYAEFPGGVENFLEYLKENLRYPPDALKDSLKGVVYVGFTLGADGAVISSSVSVQKSLSASCDVEAKRLIVASPKWIPAKANDQSVKQQISFPITFDWTLKH